MYEPFGAFSSTPTGTNPSVTDRGFTGHRQNNTGTYDLKLIYMNARYYYPQLGRFVSPDSIVPEPGIPQAYNRYAYSLNNPVKYNDPSGHWFESLLDVASIIYDVYDIHQNGLNWTSGLSLAADVASLALPVVTGGGVAVRAVAHGDDVTDILRMAGHLGDGAHAIITATNLRRAASFTDEGLQLSDEGVQLVKSLAEQSTRGSGSRVVNGQAVEGAGYVAEAQNNGGIYYQTAEGVWDALGQNANLAWAANKQFLENQLKSGVGRIDFVGETIEYVEQNAVGTFRWQEIQYLRDNAAKYGYELIDNSWVKTN